MILDAAVRVFARQGFHTCRVSDIADEAGVAYGLVYHYFQSKDEVLDTLFLERWDVLLAAIREVDASGDPARAKLRAIASFIIESYRHDPDLMKVIIVEVTRAANSFGAAHLAKINEAFEQISGIVEQAQRRGEFRDSVSPEFAAMAFYGAIEQVLTGWIFGTLDQGGDAHERAKDYVVETICDGLRRRTPKTRRADSRLGLLDSARMTENDMVKRLMWSGLLAGLGALASIATSRAAAEIWRRAFGEDPPE